MLAIIGVLTVHISASVTYADEDLYHHNGWRPLFSEGVLENNNRTIMKISNTIHSTGSWDPILLSRQNIGYYDHNLEVKPQDINGELLNDHHKDISNYFMKQNQEKITDKKYTTDNLANIKENILHETIAGQQRKGKTFTEQENLDINILHSNENRNKIVNADIRLKHTDIVKGVSNSYEVTEATEAFEILDLLEKENKPYFQPNIEKITEKSLSDTLFNILDKYQIKINDDSTNYAISRNKHNSISYMKGYVYSAPIKIPPTQNSQNYFPLDPVLAVFLSNYGYYLPGFYGFPGNYNNIYGYLASNNIHNNKPFGSYKIYSDTDSSH